MTISPTASATLLLTPSNGRAFHQIGCCRVANPRAMTVLVGLLRCNSTAGSRSCCRIGGSLLERPRSSCEEHRNADRRRRRDHARRSLPDRVPPLRRTPTTLWPSSCGVTAKPSPLCSSGRTGPLRGSTPTAKSRTRSTVRRPDRQGRQDGATGRSCRGCNRSPPSTCLPAWRRHRGSRSRRQANAWCSGL